MHECFNYICFLLNTLMAANSDKTIKAILTIIEAKKSFGAAARVNKAMFFEDNIKGLYS